jgi:malate dehydrogenase (oxaloacetate-decarboxylating)
LDYYRKVIDEKTGEEILEVSLAGQLLLDYPLLNKGMAFTDEERREFGLLGLLPPRVSTVEEQLERNYENYRRKESDIERYIFLMSLQERNETLFYKLLGRHISEMTPIIYTPVVGAASELYSHIYRRPRGLYISHRNRGEIKTLLSNAPHSDVAIIVVTDGERVLGLGDLGVGGMGIPVGKLSLYTLCAGIHPATTLPIFLDVGTDNEELLKDPLYIGLRHERVRGREYDDFIGEFVGAVIETFPNATLQWEDFARHNARRLLDRYQDSLSSFNDDIQGTGAVSLAGMLAAVKVNGERLSDQRIAMFGAGSAATGIAEQIVASIVSEGCSEQEAKGKLWLIDIGGLVHTGRGDIEEISRPFAQPVERIADWRVADRNHIKLADVVKHLRPTALIGTAAQPGAFTQDVVEEMARHVARPIIFPLSNPTSRSEAKPTDLLDWTSGRAIIATGSPFPDAPPSISNTVSNAVAGGGRPRRIGQCNNAYIFPGVGLGVIASGARRIRQEMFLAAARSLSEMSPALNDPMASLFPDLNDIREVSRRVAIAVGAEAQALGLAEATTPDELENRVDRQMWTPRYLRYRRKFD